MQTNLAPFIRDTADGKEAEAILRKCTHCGMCTATCPTYQLLYDELDGPRGRIYLIKQTLEGATPTPKTQLHLDRCLTCRSCETTCPTGVRYGRLLEIGRDVVERQVGRTPTEAGRRRLLRSVVPSRRLFSPLLALGQLVLPLLPQDLQRKVPAAAAPAKAWPTTRRAHSNCSKGLPRPVFRRLRSLPRRTRTMLKFMICWAGCNFYRANRNRRRHRCDGRLSLILI